jgi:hypothetical protein
MAAHLLRERRRCFQFPRTKTSGSEQKIEALQGKLQRKDEVIAEIMEDFIRTKKELGES